LLGEDKQKLYLCTGNLNIESTVNKQLISNSIMHKRIFLILTLAVSGSLFVAATAQVTIGSLKQPEPFSLLELISDGSRGLRLPQLTALQRDTIDGTETGIAGISASMLASRNAFAAERTDRARGLQIYNTTTNCVETWNGSAWISVCGAIGEMPEDKNAETWAAVPWVGAFWRDSQTGERIIASKGAAGVSWTARVYDEDGSGSWLTLDNNGGYDRNLWTDNPGNAEDFQLPFSRKTVVSGTGDILFRIGATEKNPAAVSSSFTCPDGADGRPPRYGKVLVSINGGAADTIFCRQGEAADYLFRPTDNATGVYTGLRDQAAMFSPYNLEDAAVNETLLWHNTAVNGGRFVDYPTQAGSFWQWGTDLGNTAVYQNYLRMAYHPVNPVSAVSVWDSDNLYTASNSTWSQFTGENRLETCPQGWRRFMVGDTAVSHQAQPATESELMHSLFNSTSDDYESLSPPDNNRTNYRYWGYYADGFFDRRPMNASGFGSDTSPDPNINVAVSWTNRRVAYVGLLFTNPDSGASLFMPAAGYRLHSSGADYSPGIGAYYWSSSPANNSKSWHLHSYYRYSYQLFSYHNNGYSVRCVRE
jgi:hypothetical protein